MSIYDDFLKASGSSDRAGQREAVRLLLDLSDGESVDHYALQAPTGTGKSYAALLAGVHNAKLGRRTIIGTSTVVLSEQYARDMQIVFKAFPWVKFCLLKGASNYFCGNKVAIDLKKTKSKEKRDAKIHALVAYKKGLVHQLPFWATADTEFCAGCADDLRRTAKTECEYAKARAQALQADVVVTTHAMINVDTKLRKRSKTTTILGKVWLTIFDEAHKAFDSLTYNETFGNRAIRSLDFHGILDVMPYAKLSDFVMHFDVMKEKGWAEEQRWVNPDGALAKERLAFWPSYTEIKMMKKKIGDTVEESQHSRLLPLVEFLAKARDVLDVMERGINDGMVGLWVRDGSYKMQEMVPDDELVESLARNRTAWMSATLGTHGHKTYSLDKCGFGTLAKFYDLASPFDYSKQLSWTVRTDRQVQDETGLLSSINNHWDGGMVVLTPFHKRKERITERMQARNPGLLVQMQASGTGTGVANASAVKSHCDVADAGGKPVLVGVEVFSTGIDLPGPRLSKLVVAGLFPLRDDLAYQTWRGRWLEAVGGDGFGAYELPERAIVLEQQIGRVIRRVSDEGVVVFYVDDKDWKAASKGKHIIEEALKRFPGVRSI